MFFNFIRKTYCWWAILCLCTACQESYLSVRTDYLSHENLASYFVNTPDPRQDNPPLGQRLIICWSIPKPFLCYENLHLQITLRFRNREESVETLSISKIRGHYIYSLLNEDYFERRGILTYKVDLMANNTVLEEWHHQMWTDLITLSPPEPTEVTTDEFEDF